MRLLASSNTVSRSLEDFASCNQRKYKQAVTPSKRTILTEVFPFLITDLISAWTLAAPMVQLLHVLLVCSLIKGK